MASWCAKSSEQRNRSRRSNKPAIWRGRAYKKARRGIDPVGERRQEQQAENQRAKREERRQRETVSAAIDRYLVECRTGRWRKSKKPMRPGYFEETRRSLEVDVKPVLGDRAIREITRGDIRALLDGIVDKGSPSQANHVLAYLRAMLNWAVSNQLIDANPADKLEMPSPSRERDRALNDDDMAAASFTCGRPKPLTGVPPVGYGRDVRRNPERRHAGCGRAPQVVNDEMLDLGAGDFLCVPGLDQLSLVQIRLLWHGCEAIGWPFEPLFQLLLLTAARRGEVAEATRDEIDLAAGVWTLPRERAKNDKEHVVHLSALAREIIERLPEIGDYRLLFTTPARATHPTEPSQRVNPRFGSLR